MSPTNTSTVPAPPPSQRAPPTFAACQNYEGSTGKIVTSARLNDFVNGAEMHVAFRSTSLGSMEVRAIVHEGREAQPAFRHFAIAAARPRAVGYHLTTQQINGHPRRD